MNQSDFDFSSDPPSIKKSPDAELDYWIDWTDWLAGDVATNVAWTVPDGLTQPQPPIFASNKATVYLGGGAVGESYLVSCHIVVTPGVKEDTRSFVIMPQLR